MPIYSVLDQGTALRAVRDGKPGRRQAAPAAYGAGAVSHRQPPGHRPHVERKQAQRGRDGSRQVNPVEWSGLPPAAPVQPRDWLATESPGRGTSSTARTCPTLLHSRRPRSGTIERQPLRRPTAAQRARPEKRVN